MKTTGHMTPMVIVLLCVVLMCTRTARTEEPDYFPLQVGNRWVYEHVNPYPGITWAKAVGTEGVSRTAEEPEILPDKEMSVVDTIRLADSVSGRFGAEELLASEDGQTYYILSGDMMSRLVGCVACQVGSALLVRRNSTNDNTILLRGWFGNAWTIHSEEMLLFDFYPTLERAEKWGRDSTWGTGPKECGMIYFGPMPPQLETIDVPAGSFPDVGVVRFDGDDASFACRKWFARDVGLIQSRSMTQYRLKSALVNGTTYSSPSTSVSEATWGAMKTDSRP